MDYFDLFRAHQGYLERLALALLGNRADAEDAVQEAAYAGYRGFGQLRGGAAAFRPWLRQILVRQCCRILRRRQRFALAGDLSDEPAPGPDPEATAL